MAAKRTPEVEDAVARARAETTLFISRYSRRLKTRAVEIAVEIMDNNPEGDPDDAGREGFVRAGRELKLLTRAATAAAEKHN